MQTKCQTPSRERRAHDSPRPAQAELLLPLILVEKGAPSLGSIKEFFVFYLHINICIHGAVTQFLPLKLPLCYSPPDTKAD